MSMASWEDGQDIHCRLPTAWGQAAPEAEGNVKKKTASINRSGERAGALVFEYVLCWRQMG